MSDDQQLSRRERQIMDILFAEGEATVNQIRDRLPDPPTPTAVRTLLHILARKGQVRRQKRGREYLYRPAAARSRAGQSALRRVIETFFDGSLDKALGAHLADRRAELSDDELARAMELIEHARQREPRT